MDKQEVIRIIKKYKRSNKQDILRLLPIYKESEIVGYMRPLTFDYSQTLFNIVKVLSDWRRDNPTAGTGTFVVTDERTEKWLIKNVLDNEDRIIFLITDLKGDYIGHIGLAEFDEENLSADIDAVLRGVKNNLPGIMSYALKTIIVWGKDVLGLQNIYLDVYDDNVHAIKFYKRNNFAEVGKISLVKVRYENEVKWEIDKNLNPQYADKCYIRMKYMGD